MKQHELELLADYVGGALDGTPEAAEVTRKIRDNAAWAEAHSQLVIALRRVDEQLREVSSTPETMPDDVWARLETALGDPALSGPAFSGPTLTGPRTEPPIWVPPAPHQPPAPPRRASRRWRWLAPVGVAAAVLGCFGLGSQVLRPNAASDSANTTAGKGVNPESAYSLPSGLLQLTSGRDYTSTTLAVLTDNQALAFATKDSASPPAALTRLSNQAALGGCLEAINQIAPGAATVVDFASYQGNPALIVVVARASGGKWVGVAGPACSPGQPDLKDQRVFE